MTERNYKIGIVQMRLDSGDTQSNLDRGIEFIRKAASQGAKLICLPELFYSGYFLDAEPMQKLAEPVDGRMVQTLSLLAKELNVYIMAGYAESVDIPGRIYNSTVFIDDQGVTIGNARKVYLWGDEKKKFRAGENFNVYDTPIGKIGILICYDIEYPEPSRIMALKGAELVVVTSVWSIPAKRRWELDVPGNALFNLMYIAGVNPVEDNCCGMSMLAAPNGEIQGLASETEEQILICDIDLDEVIRARCSMPYFNDFKEDTFSMDALNKY